MTGIHSEEQSTRYSAVLEVFWHFWENENCRQKCSRILCLLVLHHNGAQSNKRGSTSSTGSSKIMDISTPYNTIHVTHVGFDPKTNEFTGLPREWQILLKTSGITKTEQKRNPQVCICLSVANVYTRAYLENFRPSLMRSNFIRERKLKRRKRCGPRFQRRLLPLFHLALRHQLLQMLHLKHQCPPAIYPPSREMVAQWNDIPNSKSSAVQITL